MTIGENMNSDILGFGGVGEVLQDCDNYTRHSITIGGEQTQDTTVAFSSKESVKSVIDSF